MIINCPLCDGKKHLQIFSHNKIPVFLGKIHRTRESALDAECTEVSFVRCANCNFVFNRCNTQLDYRTEYETSRSESVIFQKYLKSIIERIIFHLSLISGSESQIKKVLEIGAGDGHFAREFVKLYPVKYFAVDSSWIENSLPKINGVTCIAGIYEKTMDFSPDLVILRHVLEHQSLVREFMNSILHEAPKYVFIEIPCYEFLAKGNYHCFSNDHCSYFTKSALKHLMNEMGYDELLNEFSFEDEYIVSLWGKKEKRNNRKAFVSKINDNYELYDVWMKKTLPFFDNKSILWGGAGKGKILCNLLGIDYRRMPYIVDINKNIWGHYVPITGNEIVSPQILNRLKPEKILITSPLYEIEITNLVRLMGLDSQIISIFGT